MASTNNNHAINNNNHARGLQRSTLHYTCDSVVVRASASQSVDLWFIPFIEPYQKTLENGIHSFLAWRSAFMGGCGGQAGTFACCVLGQST